MKKILVILIAAVISVTAFSQTYQPLGSTLGNNIQAINALKALYIPKAVDTSSALNGKYDSLGMLVQITGVFPNVIYHRDSVSTGGHKWTAIGSGGGGGGGTQSWDSTMKVSPDISSSYTSDFNGNKWLLNNLDTFKITTTPNNNSFYISDVNGAFDFNSYNGLYTFQNVANVVVPTTIATWLNGQLTQTDINDIVISSDTSTQWSVDSTVNAPPVGTPLGSKVLVGTSPSGVFIGHANEIATSDGAGGFTYQTANSGDLLYDTKTDFVYKFSGGVWTFVGKMALHQGGDRYGVPIISGSLDAQPYQLKTNGVVRIRVSNAGAIQFNNAYTFPTTNGTGVLTNNGSGTLTWSAVSGFVTGVTATSPITSSGGATPNISTSMSTNKLIGRSTAGTGVMEEITVGTGLLLSGGTLSSTVSGGITTADNGLTANTATNVRLGGTLVTNTTIDGAFTLNLNMSRLFTNQADSISFNAANDIGINSLSTIRLLGSTITAKASTATFGSNTKSIFHYETGTGDSIAIEAKADGMRFVNTPTGSTGSILRRNSGGFIGTSTTVNAATELTGIVPVVNGGTSLATLTANNLIVGNGTSAVTFIAPSTSGNILTSNGTTWVSAAPGAASSVRLDQVVAANTTASPDHLLNKIEWQWSTLAGTDAFKFSSASTLAASNAQTLLNIALSGTNGTSTQTTYALQVSNAHAGTQSSNVGASFSATNGTTGNYAILVPNGLVGIGTATPTEELHMRVDQNAATAILIDNQTNNTAAGSSIVLKSASESTGFIISALPSSNLTGGSPLSYISSGTNNMALRTATAGKNISLSIASGGTLIAGTNLTWTGIASSIPMVAFNDGGTGATASTLLRLQTSWTANGAIKNIQWFDGAGTTASIGVKFTTGSRINMVFGSMSTLGGYNTNDLMTLTNAGNLILQTAAAATDNGHKLDVYGDGNFLGAVYVASLGTAAITNVTNVGVAGSTSYTYKVVAKLPGGSTTAASAGQSTATGNATLTGSNFNRIAITAVTGATSYDVYRTASSGTPSTTGKIGTATLSTSNALSFDDTGLAGDATTPPTENTTGNLGVGVTTTTAALHIKAGVASVGGAPLKFISGTDLTTGEDGAVNYNGTDLRLSVGTTWYTINKSLTGSGALDFGSTVAGASTDLTITVTGAADGDVVALGTPNGSTNANGVFTAWVSAANTVTVRFTNTNLVTTLDPASGTFKVRVIK